ncbi:MAG: citrate/2-methylcitrate synthase [Firmicutes bacterium]|nr:citrate/2-methylcitrate synthase [Bacillota bacterium]
MQNYEKMLKDTAPEIERLAEMARQSTVIDNSYYKQYDVKRGLRDVTGEGVLAGLTEISEIIAFDKDEHGHRTTPCDGILRYRGIDIRDLVAGFDAEKRFGFEETVYLLLFGKLPTAKELKEFCSLLGKFRMLPSSFVRDVIMKAPSSDMMNSLSRGVLTLYSYDENADDISIPNILRQCIGLISQFPLIAVYSYHAYKHYHDGESMYIHNPDPKLSTCENMLRLLRPDSKYSEVEAKVLDLMLVLHAEHGGGNNSTFTTHVVSSSASDTYSVIAAALGSLKGPRHGGANIKVVKMFEDMKANLKDRSDKTVKAYLLKILNKEAFDGLGLIYGMGHAVYSLSDPRALILKKYVRALCEDKKQCDDFELYEKIERLAPEVIAEKRNIYKGVSANIDFYSGFVNSMLNFPPELYAPIFAMARIAGWSAHRIEEMSNNGKIIRPNYECVMEPTGYTKLKDRK